MTTVRLTGWGSVLPDKTVTNTDLEGWLDTSDEWIRERTGIAERRVGSSTTELAVAAAREALERSPGPVDLVLVATITPDQTTPATASVVQAALGLDRCAAFDLHAACSGFVYGLVVARGLMATGMRRVLLVGAETLSRITDWDDRETAVLFGDGAAAVVLEADDGPETLLGHHLGGDGHGLPAHGRARGLPASGAGHGRVVDRGAGAGGRHRRGGRPVRPPPGQPPHHRGCRRPAGDPGRAHRDRA